VLATEAGRAGVSAEEAMAVLRDERYATPVRDAQQLWLDREVHAVPNFVFNEQFSVPGAQEAGTFVRLLNRIYDQQLAHA